MGGPGLKMLGKRGQLRNVRHDIQTVPAEHIPIQHLCQLALRRVGPAVLVKGIDEAGQRNVPVEKRIDHRDKMRDRDVFGDVCHNRKRLRRQLPQRGSSSLARQQRQTGHRRFQK